MADPEKKSKNYKKRSARLYARALRNVPGKHTQGHWQGSWRQVLGSLWWRNWRRSIKQTLRGRVLPGRKSRSWNVACGRPDARKAATSVIRSLVYCSYRNKTCSTSSRTEQNEQLLLRWWPVRCNILPYITWSCTSSHSDHPRPQCEELLQSFKGRTG